MISFAVATSLKNTLLRTFAENEHKSLIASLLEQNQTWLSINDGFQISYSVQRLAQRHRLTYLAIMDTSEQPYASSDPRLDSKFKNFGRSTESFMISQVRHNSQALVASVQPFFHPGKNEKMRVVVIGGNQVYSGILSNLGGYITGIYSIAFIALGLILVWVVARMLSPLIRLTDELESLTPTGRTYISADPDGLSEVNSIRTAVNDALRRRYKLEDEAKEHAISAALIKIATRVAHDIRSPLAALRVIERDNSDLPGEVREILSTAIRRIAEIAHELLAEHRKHIPRPRSDIRIEDVNRALLDHNDLQREVWALITEHRLQIPSDKAITFDVNEAGDIYGSFVQVNLARFRRSISNLLANAIEATNSSGEIEIILSARRKNFVTIIISDTGRGIPNEIVEKLGTYGYSFGKKDGNGLGLYDAKRFAEDSGGSLTITSKQGNGTRIMLELPKAAEPAWYVPSLKIGANSAIIVVDDESIIQDAWKRKFQTNLVGEGVHLSYFSSADAFKHWILRSGFPEIAILLIDYNLITNTNGIDLVRDLGLQKHAIIVSGEANPNAIRQRCSEQSLRFLSKADIPNLPIIIEEFAQP